MSTSMGTTVPAASSNVPVGYTTRSVSSVHTEQNAKAWPAPSRAKAAVTASRITTLSAFLFLAMRTNPCFFLFLAMPINPRLLCELHKVSFLFFCQFHETNIPYGGTIRKGRLLSTARGRVHGVFTVKTNI